LHLQLSLPVLLLAIRMDPPLLLHLPVLESMSSLQIRVNPFASPTPATPSANLS